MPEYIRFSRFGSDSIFFVRCNDVDKSRTQENRSQQASLAVFEVIALLFREFFLFQSGNKSVEKLYFFSSFSRVPAKREMASQFTSVTLDGNIVGHQVGQACGAKGEGARRRGTGKQQQPGGHRALFFSFNFFSNTCSALWLLARD